MPEVEDIDQLANAGVGITVPHRRVHKGETWIASSMTADASPLADDALRDCLIVVALTRSAHLTVDVAAGGDVEMLLFEIVSVSNNGSQLGTPNLNRESGASPDSKVYLNPTITDQGVTLLRQLLPGGTKNFSPGGTARVGTEWILLRGALYVLRVINRAGSAQPVSMMMQWYEVEGIVA